MGRFKLIVGTALVSLLLAPHADAGMTVITLTDIAEARLDSISFFIVTYLILALAVKGLWNYLGKAFTWMPRINYPRALALMLVSGLFLYVILTMISGARELLTPGAWKKQGVGYELQGNIKPPSKDKRLASMQDLKKALWSYASKNEGKLPAGLFDQSIPSHHWALPEVPGYYAYFGGKKLGAGRKIIAYEPAVMGGKRYVLLADGSIEAWSVSQLTEELGKND